MIEKEIENIDVKIKNAKTGRGNHKIDEQKDRAAMEKYNICVKD